MDRGVQDLKLGRHRGKFVAIWYDQVGKRQRRSLGTDVLPLAETRLAALRAGLSARAKPVTTGDIFNSYVSEREADGKATERMRAAWKRLRRAFGNIRPEDISKTDVRAYIASRRRDRCKDGTIHTELVYLRAALAFAVKEGWIASAPYIKLPQKPAPKEHHLTREEARKLIDAAVMPHVKLFVRLALGTAGRASALLELNWERVDFEHRRIQLRDPERHATRKGRATVPINDSLLEALQEAKQAACSQYVIEWGGKRVASIKKGVAAAAQRAGVKCSPHVLRHTAAVWMAEGGVPMEEIAQYLGHEDARTTYRIYARFSPTHLRGAAALLEV